MTLPLLLAAVLASSSAPLVRAQQGTTVRVPSASGLYVDSVNGNDANGGRNRGSALKTIAALLAKSPAAGSHVWVARGSYWREELSGLAAGVIVRAYGSGNRPVFDAADVAVNANFTKTGGRTNVYQITWAHELDALNKVKHSAWENGARLARVADVATCDATAGSFYAPAPDTVGKSDVLYVHPSGNTNPTSDGKTYEFAKRKYGLVVPQGGAVDGAATKRNGHNDGSLVMYAGGVMRNSQADDGTVHNVFNTGLAEDVSATGNETQASAGAATIFVTYANAGGGTVTYRRCHATCSGYGTLGYYAHTDAAGGHVWDQIVVEDSDATNCEAGFGGVNTTTFRYTATIPTHVWTRRSGIAFSATPTGTAYVTGGVVNGWYTGGETQMISAFKPSAGATNYVVRDLTVYAKTSSGGVAWLNGGSFDAQRSVFKWTTDKTGYPLVMFKVDAGSLTLASNTIGAGSNVHVETAAGVAYSSDYNVLDNSPGMTVGGVYYPTMAAYRSGTGQDANSTLQAVPLVDPSTLP